MKYCSTCGNVLEERKRNTEWYCVRCKAHTYANPIPTIDAMLIDENDRILLGKRNRQPDKGKLNLPGGFVDPEETLEQAIERELKEELQLTPSDYGPLSYGGSRINYHTEDGKNRQLISVIMVGHMPHRDFDANDEVDEYVWKHPSELKADELTNEGEYKHIIQAATSSGYRL